MIIVATTIFRQSVNEDTFYIKYYTALNGVLNLSNKQLQVLAEFSSMRNSLGNSNEFTEDQKDSLVFSSEGRNIVADKLGISIYNLNNLIRALKEKKYILDLQDKGYILNPMVYTPINKSSKELTFKFNIENYDK